MTCYSAEDGNRISRKWRFTMFFYTDDTVHQLSASDRYGYAGAANSKRAIRQDRFLRFKYAIDATLDLGTLLGELHELKGDILIIRTNGSRSLIGRAAVAESLPYPVAFASYLIQLKLDPEVC